MKKVYIETMGCQMNKSDTERMFGMLSNFGYEETDTPKEADLLMVNTCSIRQLSEDKAFSLIGTWGKWKKTRPELKIGFCGCVAQQKAEEIFKRAHYVDFVLGTHKIYSLPDIIKKINNGEKVCECEETNATEDDKAVKYEIDRVKSVNAWIPITEGCNNFCTYCIVPYTRGKERSRLMSDIIDEVKGLKEDGYQEITLLGQNVNSYGKDLEEDYDFATLLKEVAKTGIARIRFTTSHPWDFSREMIEIINQYDNIMPYIHLPVQSGNTEILKLMGRRYTREQYLELFHMIKEVMPDCSITTDIIVGFPNETEEQFQDTLSLYEECEYDLAYTFIYSPREGTPAAKMQDNVPFEQKQDRLERLNEVVKEKALKQNQRFLNQIVDVLVDGPSKRDETMMTGYTAHQKLINFKGRKEDIGKIVPVKVTEVKTWALKGEQVD